MLAAALIVQDSYLPAVVHPIIFDYPYVVVFTISNISWTLDLASTIEIILRRDITKPVSACRLSLFEYSKAD
jgi:hypothetical protein